LKQKFRWPLAGMILLAAGGLIYLTREPILFALGDVLVYREKLERGDAVLVIGGDASGNRVLTGAQLVKDGWAPLVLISGAGAQYGMHESERAIEFAVRKDYPRATMVGIPYPALNTVDEAYHDISVLRQLGAKRYILVTSFSHTARARRVFQRTAPDLKFTVVGVSEPNWDDGRWWSNREGRKIWFFALTKTLADYLGI
jgi:uncharacterized SAM-binding protein YcdF (DUF218 family)